MKIFLKQIYFLLRILFFHHSAVVFNTNLLHTIEYHFLRNITIIVPLFKISYELDISHYRLFYFLHIV